MKYIQGLFGKFYENLKDDYKKKLQKNLYSFSLKYIADILFLVKNDINTEDEAPWFDAKLEAFYRGNYFETVLEFHSDLLILDNDDIRDPILELMGNFADRMKEYLRK